MHARTHGHKYQQLIPINNATKREKHEINNFQRENWIWGVKNTNDANTNDDISQMCCMRERIFHKEEAWNIHVRSTLKKQQQQIRTDTQMHGENIPFSFEPFSNDL